MRWRKENHNIGNTIQLRYVHPTAELEYIELYREGTGDWMVTVHTNNPEKCATLRAKLLGAGVPANIRNPRALCCNLFTSNKAALTNFIKVVRGEAQNFEEIEREICGRLGIDLHQECTVPEWITGTFSNGTIIYSTANAASTVYSIKISIVTRRIPDTAVEVYTDKPTVLRVALMAAGIVAEDPGSPFYTSRANDKPFIIEFLRVIQSVTPNFSALEAQILRRLSITAQEWSSSTEAAYRYDDVVAQGERRITASTRIYLTQVSADSYAIKGIDVADIPRLVGDPQTRQVDGLLLVPNPTGYPDLFDETGLLNKCPFTAARLQVILGEQFFHEAERFSFSPAAGRASFLAGTAALTETAVGGIPAHGLLGGTSGLFASPPPLPVDPPMPEEEEGEVVPSPSR